MKTALLQRSAGSARPTASLQYEASEAEETIEALLYFS